MKMDAPSLSQLQERLVEVRKIYPLLIAKNYQYVRRSYLKLLNEVNFEADKLLDIEEELLAIEEELLAICNNYDNTKGDEQQSKLLDQARIMIILVAKKNCKISKIIDAI